MTPEPLPPSPWHFPPAHQADQHGIVGLGADLEPSTLVDAYRNGMFPMPIDDDTTIGWWSPPERGVLPLDDLRVSRSLRRSCRRYEVTVNRCFGEVMSICASTERPGGWINDDFLQAYQRLHQLGWAHSVETWEDGTLVGGLYGVQVNGLFAGESMFHRRTDASKVALVALVACLRHIGAPLLDVQWQTDHLATLGVQAITRGEYLVRLQAALRSPARPLSHLGQPLSVENHVEYLNRLLWMPTGIPASQPARSRP